jgi:hypothetical protein
MMIVEQSVECELAGKTEVPGEKLLQCHFVDHKSHMTLPELEPRKPATNRLSYGTARHMFYSFFEVRRTEHKPYL